MRTGDFDITGTDFLSDPLRFASIDMTAPDGGM